MLVKVAPGRLLNHNGKLYRAGEEVEIPDSVVNDPAVRESIVVRPEPVKK